MLSFIHVKNFRSLPDVTLDLTDGHGGVKSSAYIYGENGAGKSNLVSALYFLCRTFRTIKDEDAIRELPSRPQGFYPELSSEEVDFRIKNSMQDLSQLLRTARRIGVDDPLQIEVGFVIDGKPGTYSLEFDFDSVISEKLTYRIGNRNGVVYSINEDEWFLSPSIFTDRDYRSELYDNMQRYFGSQTFMSMLMAERHRINKGLFENMVGDNLIKVMDGLWNISVYSEDGKIYPSNFMSKNIAFGFSDRLGDDGMDAMEKLLNSYYTKLFQDIKRVYYRTSLIGKRLCYELVFVRELAGRVIEVPYEMESTGIKKLAELFPYMLSAVMGETAFVDEAGSGLHDIVLLELSKNMLKSISGQFVTTIHNTQLMKELPQQFVYIIKLDSHGNKTISSIKDYSFRTQKTNNVQNKYLAGDYDGIPLISALNLSALAAEATLSLIDHDGKLD